MGKLSGQTVSRAVDKFLSTYMGLKEKQQQDADREEEKRYREFYMRLQQNADTRAEETHQQGKEEWAAKQDALVREAEARQQFLETTGQSYEAWSMLNPVEQFRMQQETHALAKELNQLQIESGKFNLEQARAQAPYELQRAKYLASGGDGRGRGGQTLDKALSDKYKLLDFQQKSIESRLEAYSTRDPLTGENKIDWSRVPEPLVRSYEANSQAMTDLEQQMIPLQREMLGLGAYEPKGGPGSSEAEKVDPVTKFLSESGASKVKTADEQKATDLFRNKLGDLSNRKIAYVDPTTGELQATNDVTMLTKARAQAGGNLEVYDMAEVPTWAIGKPVDRYKQYLKAKEEGISGITGGMVDPRTMGF